MAWWILAVAAAAAFFAVDWLIVMGADPRKWKGGDDPDDFDDRFDR